MTGWFSHLDADYNDRDSTITLTSMSGVSDGKPGTINISTYKLGDFVRVNYDSLLQEGHVISDDMFSPDAWLIEKREDNLVYVKRVSPTSTEEKVIDLDETPTYFDGYRVVTTTREYVEQENINWSKKENLTLEYIKENLPELSGDIYLILNHKEKQRIVNELTKIEYRDYLKREGCLINIGSIESFTINGYRVVLHSNNFTEEVKDTLAKTNHALSIELVKDLKKGYELLTGEEWLLPLEVKKWMNCKYENLPTSFKERNEKAADTHLRWLNDINKLRRYD